MDLADKLNAENRALLDRPLNTRQQIYENAHYRAPGSNPPIPESVYAQADQPITPLPNMRADLPIYEKILPNLTGEAEHQLRRQIEAIKAQK